MSDPIITNSWIDDLVTLLNSGRWIRVTVDTDCMHADDVTDGVGQERGERVVAIPHPADAVEDLLRYLGCVVEGA